MQRTYGTHAVRADGGELCRMPVKDELARHRYEKLVDRLESLTRTGLKPEYEGYYGQGLSVVSRSLLGTMWCVFGTKPS
ncbi:hypothetical protein [Streptomyces cyaneofuscatus]|uniref:hypothetical protein n=1 Tax=Streptomyces cyaneofuscatus TaxID=66883 RepID=UPI003677FF90